MAKMTKLRASCMGRKIHILRSTLAALRMATASRSSTSLAALAAATLSLSARSSIMYSFRKCVICCGKAEGRYELKVLMEHWRAFCRSSNS